MGGVNPFVLRLGAGCEGVCNGIYANTHLSMFVEYLYQLLNTDVVRAKQQNICENLVTLSW